MPTSASSTAAPSFAPPRASRSACTSPARRDAAAIDHARTSRGERSKRIVLVCRPLGMYAPNFFPEQSGVDYEPSRYLRVLQPHKEHITNISGMSHRYLRRALRGVGAPHRRPSRSRSVQRSQELHFARSGNRVPARRPDAVRVSEPRRRRSHLEPARRPHAVGTAGHPGLSQAVPARHARRRGPRDAPHPRGADHPRRRPRPGPVDEQPAQRQRSAPTVALSRFDPRGGRAAAAGRTLEPDAEADRRLSRAHERPRRRSAHRPQPAVVRHRSPGAADRLDTRRHAPSRLAGSDRHQRRHARPSRRIASRPRADQARATRDDRGGGGSRLRRFASAAQDASGRRAQPARSDDRLPHEQPGQPRRRTTTTTCRSSSPAAASATEATSATIAGTTRCCRICSSA